MKIQYRGICQYCGREHAVLKSGLMSKHGYTVEQGWFAGVCQGQYAVPMQHSRNGTDNVVNGINEEVAKLKEKVAKIDSGEVTPETAPEGPWYNAKQVPFETATERMQSFAVEYLKRMTERRIRAGESMAKFLSSMADKYYGSPLLEVVMEEKEVFSFVVGEKRLNAKGATLTASSKERSRIYYKTEKGFVGWMGISSWKKLEVIK